MKLYDIVILFGLSLNYGITEWLGWEETLRLIQFQFLPNL